MGVEMTPGFSEVTAAIGAMRERLARGQHTPYEGLSFRCLVFYADMITLIGSARLPKHRAVETLLEVYRTAARVIAEYEGLLNDEALRGRLGAIALYGIVQCVSQLVDATARLCDILNVSTERMKQQEYWRFRTRHTHLVTKPHVRSQGDPDGFDLHVFPLEAISAEGLRYWTLGDSGYASRGVSMREIIHQLDWDLSRVLANVVTSGRAFLPTGGP
jgi:hypothetical protein